MAPAAQPPFLFVDLRRVLLDTKVAALVPRSLARRYGLIPIHDSQKELVIATTAP